METKNLNLSVEYLTYKEVAASPSQKRRKKIILYFRFQGKRSGKNGK